MENYLEHYGVQGQKWGIRRFQNKDGTLTELGRKRYGGEKAREYKQAEINKNYKKLGKAISRNDIQKANKHMRQLNALNRMSEKDITNEMLGIVQTANKLSFVSGGLLGGLMAAPIVLSKNEKGRAEKFASDYQNIPLSYIKDEFNKFTPI